MCPARGSTPPGNLQDSTRDASNHLYSTCPCYDLDMSVLVQGDLVSYSMAITCVRLCFYHANGTRFGSDSRKDDRGYVCGPFRGKKCGMETRLA